MTSDCEVPDSCLGLARDTSINNMCSSAFLFKGLASLLLLLLLVLLLFLAMLLFLLLIWVLFLEQVPVI